jgi:DNA-binding MarR family transcriptional regulator
MHSILFSVKRADQSSRALQRRLLDPYGITPARYDMLFVILKNRNKKLTRWMFQSRLRKELGYTAPTTSRMAKSLERLGLITRKRTWTNDKRQVLIELTQSALALLKRIRECVIAPGILWLALHTAMSKRETAMGSLEWFTRMFRGGSRDKALFLFPHQRERAVPDGEDGVILLSG